jgi:hypothetical protein
MTESKNLLDLDELLDQPNIDYWSDEGITIAEEILDRMSASERNALSRIAPTKTVVWKEHLSQCLRHYRESWSTNLLKEFVFDADLDVAVAAADSLRDHLPLPGEREDLLCRVKALRSQARNLYVPALNALIDGLSNSESLAPTVRHN